MADVPAVKRRVEVTWLDSQDHPDAWVAEAEASAFGQAICPVTSLGYVMSDTDKYLTIGGDWDESDQNWGRVTKITKGTILKVVPLCDTP